MAWTNIDRYRVGQPIAANDLNTLRDNITHLRGANLVGYFHDGSGSDWTLGVLDTWTKVDASKFELTITTHGGPVTVIFSGSMRRLTNGVIHYGIKMENDWIDPIPREQPVFATAWRPVTMIKPYPYLAAGTYTFSLYWLITSGSAANAATLEAATKPFMVVMESM